MRPRARVRMHHDTPDLSSKRSRNASGRGTTADSCHVPLEVLGSRATSAKQASLLGMELLETFSSCSPRVGNCVGMSGLRT
jgi:hypothetical protein